MHHEHQATLQAIKEQIWALCNQSLVNVQVAADKAKVTLPITTIAQGEAVMRVLKKKPGKKKQPVSQEAYDRLRAAKYAYEDATTDHWIKDGHFIEPDQPSNDSNGIQNYIIDFLNWSGHFANRTGNEGRVIMVDGTPKRIKSSSKNGMQDVDTNLKHPDHEFGIPWKIEVKAAGDTHKEHQKDFGKLVQRTGGMYSVVRSVDDFLSQYDRLMMVKPKQVSIFDKSEVKP